MRIGHSFDTRNKYKIIKELLLSYKHDQILIITKSTVHKIMVGLLPFFMRCGVLAGAGVLLFALGVNTMMTRLIAGVLGGMFLVSLVYQWVRMYIIHGGDFIVVTPDMIHIYNQSGLFDASCKAIYVHNIAGIYIHKQGLLDSILHEGDISIEEIGEQYDGPHVIFGPIGHPERVREKIESIIHVQGLVQQGFHERRREKFSWRRGGGYVTAQQK